jgi:hypothetical protein
MEYCHPTGTTSVNRSWDASCVHVVSSVSVTSGVTLTVEAGTVVKMSSSGSLSVSSSGSPPWDA